jgi:predicted ester cyclase
MVSVEENKRLVARVVAEVISGGDLAALDQLYAPEIADAARGWVAPFREAFPDVRMDIVALVGEGDTVVGEFRCSGTHTGPWMGRPPTGRSFRDVREVYWFTVRGGRIVDWWGLEDNDDRRRQLGRPTGPA